MENNTSTAEITTARDLSIEHLRILAIPEEYATLLSLIRLAEDKALTIADSIEGTFWGEEIGSLADKVQDLLNDSLYTFCELVGKQMGSRIYEPERVAVHG